MQSSEKHWQNEKLYTSALRFMKPIFMKYVGAILIEFRVFNRITKQKEKNIKNL